MRVMAYVASGDGVRFAAALRAYDRAEAALTRREGEHVPITRGMRQGDEIDVALALVDALHFVPELDRPHLVRSLDIEAPLRAFAARVGC